MCTKDLKTTVLIIKCSQL